MEYQKVSSAPFSKKLMNGRSFNGMNIYDGVFSSPMKVGARVKEDFGEIFSGAGSSSIPVLDVPELNERKISVDVNSSELDYSKIFGGFGDFDFAISHEEISVQSKKSDIKETWTPAESVPGSHSSNFSVENNVSSHEASFQSFDGVKQFKMSYHKANQEGRNRTNEATQVTQLHTVPGYTCLTDESAPSKNTEDDKPLLSALNCIHLKTDFSEEIMEGIHSRKTSSVHSPGGASKQASRDGVKIKNKFNHNRSNSNDAFFDAFEIGLKTHHPSKVPPPSCHSDGLGNNKGDSKISMGSKIGIPNSHSIEDPTGVWSPPYLDEEVDTNSVAAASAAALKKAIEDAQAKIKIAQEIMERKKDGLQNHVKLGFIDGPKVEKRREGKITGQTNKFREEEWQKCTKGDAPMQVFAKEMQNAMKADEVAPDFRERDDQLFAKEASHGTHGDGNNSTIMDNGQEEMKDLKAKKWGGIATKLAQSVNDFELKEIFFTMKMFEKSEETGKKLKAFEEAPKQEVERKLNAVQGACELKENVCKPNSCQGVHYQEEYGKKSTISGLQVQKEVTFETSHKVEACEKKQRRLWDLTGNNLVIQLKDNEHTKMRMLKEEQAWLEHEKKQKEALDQKQSNIRSEDFPETEENEAALEELFDPEENGKRDEATFEKVEFEKQQKESCRLEKNEERLEDVRGREDAETACDNALEQENVEVMINGLQNGELGGKKLEEDIELGAKGKVIEADKNDKRLEKSHELVETEKIQREIDEREEDERMKITQDACEHFKNDHEVANDLFTEDKTEILSKILVTSVHAENDNLAAPTHEESERPMKVSRASSKCKEMERDSNVVDLANDEEEKRTLEDEIAGLAQVVLELHNEIQNQVKDTPMVRTSEYHGLNIGVSDMDVWKKSSDQHEKESDTCCNAGNCVEELTSESEENFEEVEEAMKQGEDKSNSQFPYEDRWIDCGENVEATQEENFEEVEETMEQGEDESISQFPHEDRWIDCGENVEATQEENFEEVEAAMEQGEDESISQFPHEESWIDSGENVEATKEENFEEVEEAIQRGEDDSNSEFSHEERWIDNGDNMEATREKNFEEVEEAIERGEDDSNSEFSHEERWMDNGDNMEATREKFFEEVEEAMKQGEDESNSQFSHEKWIDSGENVEATRQEKGESTVAMHKIKTNESTEHKEDHSEILKAVMREAECSMHREVEQQKAHEKKLDEAKEKEREREMERLAVERAIREARERAFTEARERAERAAVEKANVEAHQRVMANARERLDKATAEVSDKSATDKISMEARLKAERAAVERATAEARVRALEKAMSENVTLQRRNQAVKSSSVHRENGIRHSSASNDSQYKGSGPSRSSGYSNSSSHDANGESVQRHQARLESHQRIAERAAKALAEKNLRDQLARKELAERNRLAGVLDAEVKRWSSGKAGNLRALLSTLQYILGPDSGWQPIPLTDLIATAAVKKAYRKATLCVHPDKLQQRGASVQQKYTCEKVFDLLKEAWNKFSAEER